MDRLFDNKSGPYAFVFIADVAIDRATPPFRPAAKSSSICTGLIFSNPGVLAANVRARKQNTRVIPNDCF